MSEFGGLYNTIQYNTIQLYCSRGEIRLAAKEHHKHKDITALRILYYEKLKKTPIQSISQTHTQTHTRTHTHTPHAHTTHQITLMRKKC